MIDPVQKSSVAETVFRRLRAKIFLGEFAPGQALPGERELSKSLGVNRGAVRESLQRLSQAGLVEIQHGEHTRITDFRKSGSIELLGEMLIRPGGEVDLEILQSMISLGMTARVAAVRCAAENPDAVVPLLLEKLAILESARNDLEELIQAREEFWGVLFDATGDIARRMLFNSLRKVLRPVAHMVGLEPKKDLEVAMFRGIIDVVIAGDPDAAERSVREMDSVYVDAFMETLAGRIERGERLVIPDAETR